MNEAADQSVSTSPTAPELFMVKRAADMRDISAVHDVTSLNLSFHNQLKTLSVITNLIIDSCWINNCASHFNNFAMILSCGVCFLFSSFSGKKHVVIFLDPH